MTRFLLLILLLLGFAHAQDISPAKYAKLVQKGEKVALKLCDEHKLSQIKAVNLPDIYKQIENTNPCMALNSTK